MGLTSHVVLPSAILDALATVGIRPKRVSTARASAMMRVIVLL